MNEQQLREQLRYLAEELEYLPPGTDKRQTVELLIADIESKLRGEDPDDSLLNQVEAAVSSFEAEYPRIAGILNNIVVTLGNIGV